MNGKSFMVGVAVGIAVHYAYTQATGGTMGGR